MDKDKDDILLIERFLDMELNNEELKIFEQRLSEDAPFKALVDDMATVDQMVRMVDPNTSQLDFLQHSAKKKPKWPWGLLLVGIICLISIWSYFQMAPYNIEQEHNQVFSEVEQFLDEAAGIVVRGSSPQDVASPVDEVITEVLEWEKEQDSDQLIKSIMDRMDATDDVPTDEVLQWWLVKLYLGRGDQESAKEALRIISNHKEYNSAPRAAELINRLK